VERHTIGSWLSGPRAAAQDAGAGLGYRGQRLGLPEHGPGSVAGFGRRLAAVVVDWVLCLAIATGLLRGDGRATLAVFAVEHLLLLSTLGSTVGKRALGLRVVRLDGGRATPLAMLVRTLLLCLAVPALVGDRDGRGLHDRAAHTVEVRA
jgi:uncharacterized RDD family membrane protein YckC